MRFMACLIALGVGAAVSTAQEQPTSQPAGEARPAALDPSTMSESDLIQEAQRRRTTGQIVDARAILKYVLDRNERNFEARVLDGELALELTPADARAARDSFREALKIQENDFRANFGLGKIEFRSGAVRTALLYLKRAESTAPPDKMGELQAYIAQCYRKNGDFPEAFAAIEKALAADPGAIEPRQVNVSLQLAVRNFDRALAEADTLVDLCTKAIPGATKKRDALTNLSGAYATRLTVLQKLGEIQFVIGPDGNPTDRVVPGREKTAAEITRRVAETYVLIADLNRTLTYFTTLEFAARAAVIDPTDLETILLVGMLQRNTYQIEEAASTFRKVLEVDPGNARARAELEAMGVPVAPASQPATKPAPETP